MASSDLQRVGQPARVRGTGARGYGYGWCRRRLLRGWPGGGRLTPTSAILGERFAIFATWFPVFQFNARM